MTDFNIRNWSARIAAGIGIACLLRPFANHTIYQNFFFAAGMLLLLLTWVIANWEKGNFSSKTAEAQQKRKVLAGMLMCSGVGLALLAYYEMQMPKYEVALIDKVLYHLPPHLDKKELRAMGADCNTYGNTFCSQAVFARIVQLDPRDFKALANLAMAQSHLGYHQQAITNFRNAIKNGVGTYDVYKFYGHSQWAQGNKILAKELYKKSLQLKPNQDLLVQRVSE